MPRGGTPERTEMPVAGKWGSYQSRLDRATECYGLARLRPKGMGRPLVTRPFGLYFSSRRGRVGPIIRPRTASKSSLGNGLLRTGAPTSRMNCA